MVEAKREELKQEITKSTQQIPDTTLNTILMCIKEIHIYNNKPLKEIAKEVTESYKLIKSLI
jgi:hypothetical protein